MPKQPWTASHATSQIRACALRDQLNLSLRMGVEIQLAERDLLPGDVLCLLRTGTVLDPPENATRGLYKYAVEGLTPNSEGRAIRALVALDGHLELKVFDVRWRDECQS